MVNGRREMKTRMNELKLLSLALAMTGASATTAQNVGTVLGSGKAVAAKSGGGFLSGIFGCSASGGKQVIRAAGGGAVGGFLGNRIAGKGSRTMGTVVGAATGAAVGSALGCRLQRNDQAKAERAMEQAVATNKSQSWSNPETGASGRVDVQGSTSGTDLAGLKFASQVEPVESYSKIGANYTANSTANVRSAPSLQGEVIGQLSYGQSVWVPASAAGTAWMLVSRDGVGQGYVSSALLQRSSGPAAGCKLVTQTVTTGGDDTATENLEACRDGQGNWVLKRV